MKRGLALAGIAAALVVAESAVADESSYVPTVQEVIAKRFTRQDLAKHWPGWSFHRYGYIDCRGGRIDRTHWRCRIFWTRGGKDCHIGRSQIIGDSVEGGHHYYLAHLKIYGCHFGPRR